jgi:hypothetical protein
MPTSKDDPKLNRANNAVEKAVIRRQAAEATLRTVSRSSDERNYDLALRNLRATQAFEKQKRRQLKAIMRELGLK